MIVGDLPVGAKLILGSYDGEEITWIKVSEECDFFPTDAVQFVPFDWYEFENVSRARRNYGNNFFPQSNILQWLNASGYDWYTAQHQFDAPPNYERWAGFLSEFNAAEMEALESREITVAVPLGSRKEFGKVYKFSCKVCLPSASELGLEEGDPVEGAEIPGLTRYVSDYMHTFVAMMTRTGVQDGGHIFAYHRQQAEKCVCSKPLRMCPMIRVKANTTIPDKPDVADRYYIQDTEFLRQFMDVLTV